MVGYGIIYLVVVPLPSQLNPEVVVLALLVLVARVIQGLPELQELPELPELPVPVVAEPELELPEGLPAQQVERLVLAALEPRVQQNERE